MTEKEKNKLIERTAKHDAYQAVYLWAKHLPEADKEQYGSALWYAEEKMKGHAEWLKEQPYEYDYATSTFIKKGGT